MIFSKSEIHLTENFHLFERRKKIVVFVPVMNADHLISCLSKAGAGVIGNYSMCSFRVRGTGTFLPGKFSKPFAGKKNKFSCEDEFRLEMECSADSLNSVIDTLLEFHPYEEVVYEVHEFLKRSDEISGSIIRLKRPMKLQNLIARLNKKLDSDDEMDSEIRSIVFTKKNFSTQLTSSAVFTGCDLVIREYSKPKTFELLITKK